MQQMKIDSKFNWIDLTPQAGGIGNRVTGRRPPLYARLAGILAAASLRLGGEGRQFHGCCNCPGPDVHR